MKLATKKRDMPSADTDMTPMIDMTFQLIAFFMVLIKFSESEVDDRVQLPRSELAKPPEKAPDHFITVQVTQKGRAIIRGNEAEIRGGLATLLQREADTISRKPGGSAGAATVFIRAHRLCPTGDVQEVILQAQKVRFEKFALRAEEETQ